MRGVYNAVISMLSPDAITFMLSRSEISIPKAGDMFHSMRL